MSLEKYVTNKYVLKILNKEDIFTIEEALNNFPNRYIEYSIVDRIGVYQDMITVKGLILSVPEEKKHKENLLSISFFASIFNEQTKVIIFNRSFIMNKLKVNENIFLYGKYDYYKKQFIASEILFKLDDSVKPIYQKGINQNYKYIIQNILKKEEIVELLPDYLLEKYKLVDINKMYEYAHYPKSKDEIKQFYRRIKYQELFLFELLLEYKKSISKKEYKEPKKYNIRKVKEFISTLPFELTEDQKRCVNEIFSDLKSNHSSNRLIEGDVGSGKTIVCAISIYGAITAGYQGALMAPTEILAIQHYHNLCNLFKNVINISLLTSSVKGKKREEILKDLREQKIDLIIGTHAILTENVEFKNLGIVVTDEQHRFGVNQRRSLKLKGLNPDVLYLSATPIPRTLAISLFGDMDLSLIRTKPSGRKKVETKMIQEQNIEIAFNIMEEELKKGHQGYVISPLIVDENNTNLNDIITLEEKLKKRFNYNIGVLHGKLKPKEKEEIMNKFQNKKIDILLSTTVVEVGVDVLNATFIAIFDAERFGLSQLHQLRGRVGRNSFDNYCLVISKKDYIERLKIITTTYDGFKLAEEDLRLRGPGDFFGVKQSGIPTFKFANLVDDYIMLEHAKEDAKEFVDKFLNETKYSSIKNYLNIKQSNME